VRCSRPPQQTEEFVPKYTPNGLTIAPESLAQRYR
jgi:hypothetical protein